jgi:putative DNA primase/helicase
MANEQDESTAIDRVLMALGDRVRRCGGGWQAPCPAHDDRAPSLSIGTGDDGRVLLHCHAGCTIEEVVDALGLSVADLFPPTPGHARATFNPDKNAGKCYATAADAVTSLARQCGEPAGRWDYHDPLGSLVGVVLRFDRGEAKKDFRPIRRDDDGWRVGAMPDPRPLYRLPEVIKAETVLVCEGEKAADAACAIGFVATTSAGGSQAPGKSDWRPLAGKRVVILPDNDDPGRKYADDVASLAGGAGAAEVKVVELAGLPPKGDVADWVVGREPKTAADELRKRIDTTAPRGHLPLRVRHRRNARGPTRSGRKRTTDSSVRSSAPFRRTARPTRSASWPRRWSCSAT